MKIKKRFKLLLSSLVLSSVMTVTAFASEAPLATITEGTNPVFETQKSDNMIVTLLRDDVKEDIVPMLSEEDLDASRVISGHDSSSGKFLGNYMYRFTGTDTVFLDIYMPNYSGADWLQGNISLIGSDGSNTSVTISNISGDLKTITFTGIKPGVDYYFSYNLHSIGTSKVAYFLSAARVN